MICPHCGAQNDAGYLECVRCHARRVIDLSADTSTPVAYPRHSAGPSAPPAPSVPSVVTPPADPTLVARPVIRMDGAGAPSATSGYPTQAAPAPSVVTPPAPRGTGSRGQFAKDVTRYLCAAVQVDSLLNRAMLQHSLDCGARSVASSPGVDTGTVLRWGVAARGRQLLRDVFLLVSIVVTLFLVAMGIGPFGPLLGYLLAFAIVLGEMLYTAYGILSPNLRRQTFDPHQAPEPRSGRACARIQEIEARDRGNVTVFSEFTPYVGRGLRFNGFAFALSLRPKKHVGGSTAKPVPFTVHDAREHVARAVRSLGLPGVSVEDELFVSGLDLLDQLDAATVAQLLPDPRRQPASSVDAALLYRLHDDPRGRARSYLSVQIAGWSGELVITILLRVAVAGNGDLLYLESDYLVLPPVRERYRDVDRLGPYPSLWQLARYVARASWLTPIRTAQSLVSVTATLLHPIARFFEGLRQRRAILQDRTFNYGAEFSVRENAATYVPPGERWRLGGDKSARRYFYSRYFQLSDQLLFTELTQSRIMGSLVEFLDAHGYDARELSERQMTINSGNVFGNGTRISGGNVVGANSSVRQSSSGGGSSTN